MEMLLAYKNNFIKFISFLGKCIKFVCTCIIIFLAVGFIESGDKIPLIYILILVSFFIVVILLFIWILSKYPKWDEQRKINEYNVRAIHSLGKNPIIRNIAIGLDIGFWNENVTQNRKELYGEKFCSYWYIVAEVFQTFLKSKNESLDKEVYSKEKLNQFLLEFIDKKELTEYSYQVWRANKLNQIYDENQEKFDKHPKLWDKVLEKYKETEIKERIRPKGETVKFYLAIKNLQKHRNE